jgi:DNA polymerase-3 subunit gamma/tau
MSASTSLYRKYRSQSFDELVGQEPVVRTLKNAIASGRIAHAYLFTGPRGVGKTSAARLLARAANCTAPGPDKPCGRCPNCVAGSRETITDLIEIDAASNTGVDNIREVIERANFAPSVWHTKFYIIDEVHMLSTSAFNALLKTLEEPPPHTAFILATTEVHKVPATVASRCQRFDFRRIPLNAMVERLEYVCRQEGIEADRAALEQVARHSTGSLRDALSLLDQLRVFAGGHITQKSVQDLLGASGSEQVADFVDSLVNGDLPRGLKQINAVQDEGLDLRQFNRQVVEHLRCLLLIKAGAATAEGELLDVTQEIRRRMIEQASRVDMPRLLRWVKEFADADPALRTTAYRQLPLEMALVSALLGPDGDSGTARTDRSEELVAGTARTNLMPGVAPEQTARPRPPGVERVQANPRPTQPAVSRNIPPPIHATLSIQGAANEANIGGGDSSTRLQADHADADGIYSIASSGDPAAGREAPVSEAMRGSGGPLSGDELERLLGLWADVVDQIRARSSHIAAAFRNPDLVRPLGLSGGMCTIGFLYPLQAKRCRMEPWRGIIEQALSRVMGYPVRVESVTFDQVEGGTGTSEAVPPNGRAGGEQPKPSPYETPRGRAAMNIFGITKFEDQ